MDQGLHVPGDHLVVNGLRVVLLLESQSITKLVRPGGIRDQLGAPDSQVRETVSAQAVGRDEGRIDFDRPAGEIAGTAEFAVVNVGSDAFSVQSQRFERARPYLLERWTFSDRLERFADRLPQPRREPVDGGYDRVGILCNLSERTQEFACVSGDDARRQHVGRPRQVDLPGDHRLQPLAYCDFAGAIEVQRFLRVAFHTRQHPANEGAIRHLRNRRLTQADAQQLRHQQSLHGIAGVVFPVDEQDGVASLEPYLAARTIKRLDPDRAQPAVTRGQDRHGADRSDTKDSRPGEPAAHTALWHCFDDACLFVSHLGRPSPFGSSSLGTRVGGRGPRRRSPGSSRITSQPAHESSYLRIQLDIQLAP